MDGAWPADSRLGARAVRWDAGATAATELGNLGTGSAGATNTYAQAMNAVGTVVGHADKYVSNTNLGARAVRWDAGGTAATELGNLGTNGSGVTTSDTYAINAAGIAIGYAQKYESNTLLGNRAVAWGADGVALDLNTLLAPNSGWVLNEARGISDTNWITGYGTFDPDGAGPTAAYNRMFLIQVPEPGSLSLVAVAVTALLARRRGRC